MMDKYSVRLSRADAPKQLLGSGTLIIRQGDRQAFLLTCAHVVRGLDDEEVFWVEYYANQGANPTKHLRSKGEFIQRGKGAFNVPEEDLPVGEDYVCYSLPWEPWMGKLSDTQWERPTSLQRLSGFGFPQRKNEIYCKSSPMGGGTALNAQVSNCAQNDGCFYCRFLDQTILSLDDELLGLSGTGLFDKDKLVGIVKGRNPIRDGIEQYEFAALSVSEILPSLYQAHPSKSNWENAALVRWLSNPLGRDGPDVNVLAMAAKTVNLWCLLLVLREPVVIILLNRSSSMKKALSGMDWLDARWRAVSADGEEPTFSGNQGIVYTVPYHKLNSVREILKSWRLFKNAMPILLHIDLTEDTAHDPSLPDQGFWKRLAGQKEYILLASEDYFVPKLLSEGHRISDTEIEKSLSAYRYSAALYDNLIDCVQYHPLDMDFLLNKLLAEKGGWQQKVVLYRLAFLHKKLTGEDITAFVKGSYYRVLPFLNSDEMRDLFWYVPNVSDIDWDEETDALYESICWLKERLHERDWAGLAEFLMEHDMAYLDQAIEWIDKQKQEDFDGLCGAFSRLQGGTTYELIMSLRSRWGMARLRVWTEESCYSALMSALSQTRPCSGDTALDQMVAYVWQRVAP